MLLHPRYILGWRWEHYEAYRHHIADIRLQKFGMFSFFFFKSNSISISFLNHALKYHHISSRMREGVGRSYSRQQHANGGGGCSGSKCIFLNIMCAFMHFFLHKKKYSTSSINGLEYNILFMWVQGVCIVLYMARNPISAKLWLNKK